MEKIKNKVEQVLHKDKDTTHTGTTHTGTTHTGTTHTGGDPSGPHHSHAANVADPRVDSDRPGGYGNTVSAGGATHTGLGSGTTGTTGYGSTTGTGHSTNAGPHSSNIANKLDPRVDSDRDGSATAPGYGSTTGTHAGTGLTGHTGTHASSGLTGHTGTHTSSGLTGTTGHSTNAGPHSTNLGNKVDPRYDSDLDGRAQGYGTTAGTGLTGTHGTHTGTHTGTDLTGATGTHTGTGHNTAGPHSNDLANKLDPRVDSDLDGSKTIGNNRTY